MYDYGIQDGRPYLVMQYIPDGNLATRLATDTLDVNATAVAEQLLDALQHIHEAGLVHRDIKPANILLDRQGRARVTDFGIARAHDSTSLTQTGMVVGTLRYLAPEVADGSPATPASDLYAAGVVLREVAERDPHAQLKPLVAALTRAQPDDRPASAAAARRLLDDPAASEITGTAARARRDHAPGTAVTRLMAIAQGATHAAARRSGAARRIPRQTRWAIAAMTVVIVILASIALASGGSSPKPASDRRPAAASAPLSDQLHALDNMVSRATRP